MNTETRNLGQLLLNKDHHSNPQFFRPMSGALAPIETIDLQQNVLNFTLVQK